jgi:hypothetical protein
MYWAFLFFGVVRTRKYHSQRFNHGSDPLFHQT